MNVAQLWGHISESIMERDFYKCVKCGCNNKKLVVHHIIPLSRSKGSNDPSNLETLCEVCHGKAHAKLTRKDNPKNEHN